jgi:hypothetical protein
MKIFASEQEDFMASEITHVIEKKVGGDPGFKPPTSAVCKGHELWAQFQD